jgi:hypothetical protein
MPTRRHSPRPFTVAILSRVKPLRLPCPLLLAALFLGTDARPAETTATAWPPITQTAKPWTYWWWMASAVDTNNLSQELTRYRDAGLGGVHIIPIYGAKGWESNAIPYLSPKWMDMLAFTVAEADRLGLGVDMTTGTGWCFGGPRVTDAEANASVVWKTYQLGVGERIEERLDRKSIQALVAFGPGGKPIDLTDSISTNGEVFFSPPGNFIATPGNNDGPPKTWTIYAVSQKPSGQRVKRAAPGGEGHMLNLASPAAMTNYLRWFDEAFASYTGPKPRAQYHDSYEYRTDWSPEFFAEFERRRGYRLQDELPALFANAQPPRARGERDTSAPAGPPVDADRIARVKCDYRETISDIMVENTLPQWAEWSRRNGFLTRNEAHGSPGNWLDLYAAADIPETEMFYKDRNKLISKFASSAAHVTGKNLVSSETGTWLAEHFTETLADMKYLLDDLFLSGVNHVFYHGTCYSPDEAPWPGWLFYASFQMNPRSPIWRDVPALNAYAARCQAVLQSGQPDNDILLYWPIHDFWSSTNGLARNMTVHARDWFEEQPVGKTAKELWDRGYAFDYVSDAQLKLAKVDGGQVRMPGGSYQVVLVPQCNYIPLGTFRQLLAMATNGATVIFEKQLPADISGAGNLGQRRTEFQSLIAQTKAALRYMANMPAPVARLGNGRVFVGESARILALGVKLRNPYFLMAKHGLESVRRSFDGGWNYLIVNRSGTNFDGWIDLDRPAKSASTLDPLTYRSGIVASRSVFLNDTVAKLHSNSPPQFHLQLASRESVILRAFADKRPEDSPWTYWQTNGQPLEPNGNWKVEFLSGGPELPAPFTTDKLDSWAKLGDANAQRFAGTALYTLRFDKPDGDPASWQLDLGKVCQSARVRLNGSDHGTLITPPFRVFVSDGELKPKDNLLEIEVTSTAANRIRDLDRRGVNWKNFHDINFVNLDYKPFNAADWPLADAGLLGPVTITPAVPRSNGEYPLR